MDFYRSKTINKTRKDHRCFLCHLQIPKGTNCFYDTGTYFGEFFSRYSHHECADKWQEINTDEPNDDWIDLEYIEDIYPHVSFERWRKVINHIYKLGV